MRLAGVVGLTALAIAASCSSFGSNGDSTTTASPDGGTAEGGAVPPAPPGPPSVPEIVAEVSGAIDGIAASASWVYFSTQVDNGLYRIPIDGRAQPTLVRTISGVPRALAVGGTTVFVGNVGYGGIGRVDESDLTTYLEADAGTKAEGLLFAGGALWWTGQDGAVHRMSPAGADLGVVQGGLTAPMGLATDGTYVWFAGSSTQQVWRADISGGAPTVKFPGENDPRAVALSGDRIFWTRHTDSTIRRATLASGASDFATGVGDIRSLAADDTYVYWQNEASTIRMRADGTGSQEVLSPSSWDAGTGFLVQGIAITPSYVFWIDAGGGKVWRKRRP